ncbi:zinc-ribbon domain-containing protein [Candidatus Bathyarchaeota archaeon]|nr:zinc-ribbon domain-containing protein [Candidatus Bathyarchaeota archaeon]
MSYCSNCGSKLSEDVYFCPKCGFKTPKGAETNAKYPSDEMREAFTRMGIELERAFNIAAKEMHTAFQKARENINQKPAEQSGQEAIVCSSCGVNNQTGAVFCRNCGNKIAAS